LGQSGQHPCPRRGSSEQISLDHEDWEARRTLATGRMFLFDSPFF
jgi:hypothetical protein